MLLTHLDLMLPIDCDVCMQFTTTVINYRCETVIIHNNRVVVLRPTYGTIRQSEALFLSINGKLIS